MTNLDDVEALRSGDPQDMLGAVLGLPRDCRAAFDASRAIGDLPTADGATAVLFCGMGGSAVAGDVVRSVFRGRLGVPVEVNRSPVLPEYAGPHTLVVCSSYSGNTAETLASFREAVVRGCRVLVITSGGTIADEASTAGIPVVPVPGGAQPRAALGHLGFASLGALASTGLLPRLEDDVSEAIDRVADVMAGSAPGVPTERNPAKGLATRIADRTPVIWGADGIGAVAAMRWKTQLNENAKIPAWWSSMSELDHNELVGWADRNGDRSFVIALRHADEDPELPPRFPLSLDVARGAGALTDEVWGEGASPLAQLMSLIAVGDLTSVYVALAHAIDPTPVEVIERLKAALAGGAG
ncbi:MAG TPA: bifunctional phosphoglucose/phosphomannose isomerase [Actinomycetota bacterium]